MIETRRLRWPFLLLVVIVARDQRSVAMNPPQDPDLAQELPRLKPYSPERARATFQIPKGFRLESVATEPQVTDPVSACYDEDGRLYVVEMRGYPFPENSPTGNVRLLQDRDADGVFEVSTIFVDGLSWPTSVVPSHGGVFIAVAPDILYARDNDGDGVADLKKVMFSGFGTQNVQGLVNGLIWGPDGWIYGTSASNGGTIVNHTRPDDAPVSLRNQDFRFRPDGSAFEALSGGGQFGHAFDDWGHRFTCNNSNHIRQIVLEPRSLDRYPSLVVNSAIADIAVEGPAAPVFRLSAPEPWRVVRTRQRVADPALLARLPPTERFAAGFFTSATGVTVYRGSAYPENYRGNAFIGDVGANLVHRKILTPRGALYEARRAEEKTEFLASPDNWFRPVNFANTPNGTLIVLDMYRETIEHPASIPEPIKQHLDLTSGRDKGRIYEIVPEGFTRRARPSLSQATTDVLARTLTDPDCWWRETAQRLLIERMDHSAIPQLRAIVAARGSSLAQGRAHALWTLAAMQDLSEPELVLAFRDPSPRVREVAVTLVAALSHRTPELEIALAQLANDADPMVRFQVAQAPMDDAQGLATDVLGKVLRQDADDPWTRLAVYSNLSPRRSAEMIHECLEAGFDRTEHGRVVVGELAELVGADGVTASIESSPAFRASEDGIDPKTRAVMLRGLGRGLRRSGKSLRDVVAGSADSARLARVFDRAADDVTGDADLASRVQAVEILGFGPLDRALRTIPELLDARHPVELQLAALRSLNDLHNPEVGSIVIDHWQTLSPSARREAAEVLISSDQNVHTLLDAIEAGEFSMTELDPGHQQAMLQRNDERIRERVAALIDKAKETPRSEVTRSYRPALKLAGTPEAGRAVFRKTCSTCHQAEGQGKAVGPDLATVAGRSPEDLLVHILEPNREVLPQYLEYTIATVDGRVLTGMIAGESANAVTLKRAEGVIENVMRNRIEMIASSRKSLMPEGLEAGLTTQDLADLIAFVRSIQTAAPGSK